MSWNRTTFPLIAGIFLLLGIVALIGPGAKSGAVAEGGPVANSDAGENNTAAKSGAAVAGVVKFDGPRPKRTPIAMFSNKGESRTECYKLHKKPALSETAIVSENGELANVFVYVKKGLAKKKYPVPEKPVVLNQEKCMFRPRVLGVRVGQDFLMRNSDGFVHNVRSYSFRNRAFNIAQPAKTPDRKKVFKRPERAVKMGCDIHRWMTAYVFAMDHPFFAVSNEKGQFKIEGVPPGEYTLAAWHEEFGEQQEKITVGSSGSIDVGFTFKPKTK